MTHHKFAFVYLSRKKASIGLRKNSVGFEMNVLLSYKASLQIIFFSDNYLASRLEMLLDPACV